MKDGQTIGQWLKWDFEANGAFEIKDKDGNHIYFEDIYGYWYKAQYDSQGYQIYFEDSNGEITDNSIPAIIEFKGHKYQLIL
jgi:hypothetical protein